MTHPQDTTPANPAQVTDAWLVRTLADVVATIEAGEFYQDYDQSVADLRILRAAIGMGGQMVDALRTLLDCPDIADNDHKDEETHAAERLARAALTAAIGAGGQAVAVKPLEWFKPDQRNTLSRAETDFGVYRTWTHFEANGRWFWSLDGYEKASGECASEDDAKAAAQADGGRDAG